ncbi:MAG TPA: hypothetical protein VMT30_02755 [Candidatus Saccharimonadia bacterium]|nr:hypothetical protein [Candidatus Saccharimonadia bacterium]
MAREPTPTPDTRKDDLRKEYEADPDAFREKYDTDKPTPPPTQDPRAPGKSN